MYALTSLISEGDPVSSEDNKLNDELHLSATIPLDLRLGEEKDNELGGVKNLREATGEESHEEDLCLSITEWGGVVLEGDWLRRGTLCSLMGTMGSIQGEDTFLGLGEWSRGGVDCLFSIDISCTSGFLI